MLRISRPSARALVGGALALVLAAGLAPAPPAGAYPDRPGVVAVDGACEGHLLALHNHTRAQAGRAPLREDPAFDQVSRRWAVELARTRSLRHNPHYVSQIGAVLPGWRRLAENVGSSVNAPSVHHAYTTSPSHRANIVAAHHNRVGIGCARDATGRVWTVVNFADHPTALADRTPRPFHSGADASARLRYWLLGAGPSEGAVNADADLLLRGTRSVPAHAVAITNTAAHRDVVPAVTRLYRATFLRDPDAAGLTHWIRQRAGGQGLFPIADYFTRSPEFVNRYGHLSDAQFVDRVYSNVLGRLPDPSGRSFWTAQMRDGWSRGRVLVGFSESSENRAATFAPVTVSWAFIQLLGRAPTLPEQLTWGAEVTRTGSSRSTVEFLVRSHGFAARAGSHAY